MKRLFVLMLCLLLLSGCGNGAPDSPEPTPTEPKIPWVEAVGRPWDEAGALLEIPLSIPGTLQYTDAAMFDGDLLLWSYDTHREKAVEMELCLLELDDGTLLAQGKVTLESTIYPQIMEDRLYLCDNVSGTIRALNKNLQVLQIWNAPPGEGSWYVGGETLYVSGWDAPSYAFDLNTMEQIPLVDGQEVSWLTATERHIQVEYYCSDTGMLDMALINTETGRLLEPPVDARFMSLDYRNGTYLCNVYQNGDWAYIGTMDLGMYMTRLDAGTIRFAGDDALLMISDSDRTLSLHDLQGRSIASCQAATAEYGQAYEAVIPNESLGGYFCLVSGYNNSHRLLYWDIDKSAPGPDIPLEPVPEPSEQQERLRDRARQLSEKYGISILVGEDCATGFLDFTAEPATDPLDIEGALDTLDRALSVYPEGFLNQLLYDTIQRVEIQLVGALHPLDTQERNGSYSAFTLTEQDRHLMVVDIHSSEERTYYHEFSHLIDSFLQWDSWQREDALFSDTAWIDLNPRWFKGYTYSYSQMHELKDLESFMTAYSTISPTEDRAQVMEFAMMEYDTFTGCGVLLEKLRFYSRCIRDAFDTQGWPETLLWEQYL